LNNYIFKHIKGLVQAGEKNPKIKKGSQMADLPIVYDSYLKIKDGVVQDYGEMRNYKNKNESNFTTIDATGRFVLPGFCDSHTHTVFAKSREGEFVDRINGLTYEEIALKGGGILNSAKAMQNISEDELFEKTIKIISKIKNSGTSALEIKSGYGLNKNAELKMLRVIKKIKEKGEIKIKATLLAAHAYPQEFKNNHQGYLDLITNEIIPEVSENKLAEYIDVFCERNYFSVKEMEQILKAAKKHNLKPKVHVNQFSILGGIEKAIEYNAISVDHLEEIGTQDIKALKKSNCIATMLPGCSHFLGIPFGDARKVINNNIALSLASDFNPGSSPCFNLSTIWSLACVKMKLKPEEAYNALTVNAAFAMGLENTHGRIAKGLSPGFILSKKINNLAQIPYFFGESFIEKVFI